MSAPREIYAWPDRATARQLPPAHRLAERNTFRPGELAGLCRVSPRTVKRWALAGVVPFSRTLGGHRRYQRGRLSWLPQTGDPQLLTLADVAELCGVTRDTAARWARERQLYKVGLPGGRLVRVWRSDVTRMLDTSSDPIRHVG